MGTLGHEQRKNYIGVFDGKFIQRVRPGTPDAVRRVNKNNQEVWELPFDFYEGKRLTSISKQEGKFGMELVLEFDHTDVVRSPWSGRHSKLFLEVVPNLDLDAPIKLRPYKFIPEDKPDKIINGWKILQDNRVVQPAFDRTEVPSLKEVIVRGNKVWDDTELMNFLWAKAFAVWQAHINGTAIPPDLRDNLEAATAAGEDDEPPY